MERIKRMWSDRRVRLGAGAALGAFGGWLYWYLVGCPAGGCPITSNVYLMIPLGAFFGYSMFDLREAE